MSIENLASNLQSVIDSSLSDDYGVEAIQLTLHQYGVAAVINGVEKHISLDSLLSAISASSSTSESGEIEGLLLPSNTFFFAQSATRINLSCYYAEGVRNIKYADQDRPSAIPNIIVSHALQKSGGDWSINTTRYFCTDRPVSRLPAGFINQVSPGQHIFGIPFTNTYSDNRMCYGSNSMPHVFRNNNLRGLDWYYQYLFETPFNDDLGVNAVRGRPSPSAWYTKLATLADEGKGFPYDSLHDYSAE